LEIGTGWGGFAIHAASRYGCRVTTTTISRQQHAYASDWLKRTGLDGRVRLLLEDYRALHGRYDKIVSIEMFEAVGFENYDQYFGACNRLLSPHGTMLLQAITMPDRRFDAYRRRCDWIQKHVFPGAELASVSGILQSLARSTQLQLFHAEDIGMHYAHTLRDWRERFVSSLPEVRRLGFDERFIRMWYYYLASCEAAFQERGIGDVQLLLTKAANHKPLWGEPRSAGSDTLPRWASQAPHKVSISQQHGSVYSNPITYQKD
jgi:cyclopropane-fatty-acyl-phospholipid synthase